MLEVEFTATEDDYVAFNLYVLSRTKRHQRIWYVTTFLWLLALTFSALNRDWLFVTVLATLPMSLLICKWTWPIVLSSLMRSSLKRHDLRGVVGRIQLVLTEYSLTEINEVGRFDIQWKDVKDVEEVDCRTFIRHTSLSGTIVPKKGFQAEEDYYKTRDFALERIRQTGTSNGTE